MNSSSEDDVISALRSPVRGETWNQDTLNVIFCDKSVLIPGTNSLPTVANKTSKPGRIHLQIVQVLSRFPKGATGGQIRQELEKLGLKPEDQTHLDRRKRDLKKWFTIAKVKTAQLVNGKKRVVVLYKYVGERQGITDEGDISQRIKAQVIHAAHGRCQMCGQTIEKHGITLVVDHKRPRDWDGTNDRDNLWAICETCNAGKKAFFDSFEPELMKSVTRHPSVHVRIGELLKTIGVGKRTSSDLLEVVADQDDWQKGFENCATP